MGKELFTEELKLAVVQYLPEGHTKRESSEKFCVSCTPLEKRVNLYKLHGTKGLLSRNDVGRQKGFDREFRLKMLQYKQEHPVTPFSSTERFIKHINELAGCLKNHEQAILPTVQQYEVTNPKQRQKSTHYKEVSTAVERAIQKGVELWNITMKFSPKV